jgi:outer membrane receptor protein involved in Fe transport
MQSKSAKQRLGHLKCWSLILSVLIWGFSFPVFAQAEDESDDEADETSDENTPMENDDETSDDETSDEEDVATEETEPDVPEADAAEEDPMPPEPVAEEAPTPTPTPVAQTNTEEESSAMSEAMNLSLVDLLNVKVTTASKKAESIFTAPSNISVITDKQIKEWGLRDLQDVLKRVPGYKVINDRDEWVFSARGNVSDNNQKYLILIDGHKMNSTENFGPGQIIELPMDLSNVKRVEIIRGPGSAVWGSEALAGVINVITISGDDFKDENYRASVTYGNAPTDFKSHTFKTNFQMGKSFNKDANISISGALVASKGRQHATDASNGLSGPYWHERYCGSEYCDSSNTEADYNTSPPFGRFQTNLGQFKPSYMLHGKAKVGDFTINSMFFQTHVKNRQFETNKLTNQADGTHNDRRSWYTTDKVFVEGAWNKSLESGLDLSWKISGDRYDQQYVPEKAPALFISWKESKLATSLDASIPFIKDVFELSTGVDFTYTRYGPSIRFDALNAQEIAGQANLAGGNDGLFTKLTDDKNMGGYALLGLHVLNKKLHFVGGTRVDYNGDRGDQAVAFAPRASAIYELSNIGSLKLVYNTGFLRPANFQRSELPVDPEKMHQVEFISMFDLSPKGIPLTFTFTGFWQRLQGIILIAASSSSGYLGNGHTNTGDYSSIGAELEVLLRVMKHDFWGNLSLARPTAGNFIDGVSPDAMRIIPDSDDAKEGDLLNYPKVMFNLGATFRVLDKLSIAPALRFQGKMDYRSAPPVLPAGSLVDAELLPSHAEYGQSDALAFVDATVTYTPIDALEIALNAKNIFNNRGPEPISVWNGTNTLYGAYVELTLRTQF